MNIEQLIKLPLASVTDYVISYVQHLFSDMRITPANYLWSPSQDESKIRISSPFVIDDNKPLSLPYIAIYRETMVAENYAINNDQAVSSELFDARAISDLLSGGITFEIGARTGSEASCLAYFLYMQINTFRHAIASMNPYVHLIRAKTFSGEQPRKIKNEVRCWNVMVGFQLSIHASWTSIPDYSGYEYGDDFVVEPSLSSESNYLTGSGADDNGVNTIRCLGCSFESSEVKSDTSDYNFEPKALTMNRYRVIYNGKSFIIFDIAPDALRVGTFDSNGNLIYENDIGRASDQKFTIWKSLVSY